MKKSNKKGLKVRTFEYHMFENCKSPKAVKVMLKRYLSSNDAFVKLSPKAIDILLTRTSGSFNHGKRYLADVLKVKLPNNTISEVLENMHNFMIDILSDDATYSHLLEVVDSLIKTKTYFSKVFLAFIIARKFT